MTVYSFDEKVEIIKNYCLEETKSINPIEIAKALMHLECISVHGPEHHVLDGAALLTAIHNTGKDFDLAKALDQMAVRGRKMPGAMCGLWGVCGSASSVGAALSILNQTTYLSRESWSANIDFTGRALSRIASMPGPRCCKRNAFNSLLQAIDYVLEVYSIELEKEKVVCEFSNLNKECLKEECPYNIAYSGTLQFNK